MESPVYPPDITSDDGLKFQMEHVSATLVDIQLELGGGRGCAEVKDSLRPGTECVDSGGQGTITVAGPVAVNLATGVMTPEVEIPPGAYRRVDFRLGDRGFKAHTRHFQESQGWNMDLTLPAGEDLRFDAASDVQVKEAGSLRVLFHQDTWLRDLPLAACFQKGDLTREDSSELLLDEARGDCQGAGDHVRNNIRSHGGLKAYSY